MSHANWLKAFALTAALLGFGGLPSAQAQDWTDYLHWPYVPPQVPGNGFEYTSLHDKFYTCLLYTSPSPRDLSTSRMPSSA